MGGESWEMLFEELAELMNADVEARKIWKKAVPKIVGFHESVKC